MKRYVVEVGGGQGHRPDKVVKTFDTMNQAKNYAKRLDYNFEKAMQAWEEKGMPGWFDEFYHGPCFEGCNISVTDKKTKRSWNLVGNSWEEYITDLSKLRKESQQRLVETEKKAGQFMSSYPPGTFLSYNPYKQRKKVKIMGMYENIIQKQDPYGYQSGHGQIIYKTYPEGIIEKQWPREISQTARKVKQRKQFPTKTSGDVKLGKGGYIYTYNSVTDAWLKYKISKTDLRQILNLIKRGAGLINVALTYVMDNRQRQTSVQLIEDALIFDIYLGSRFAVNVNQFKNWAKR